MRLPPTWGAMSAAAGLLASEEKKPKGSASLAAVVSAFVPTWATGLIFVAIFVLIRHRYPNIYAPRTYMGTIPKKHQTPGSSRAKLDWVHTMRKVPDKFFLYHHSLDTYLFLRFLRTIIFICFVGSCLTWPILMPINAAGGGHSSELDKLAIGNVKKTSFFYAHAVIAWVLFVFVMFTIARERLWLIGLRQAWALSKKHASRLSPRIVLYLSAPQEALNESNMQRFFGESAVRIWPATKTGALDALVTDRKSKVEELEVAEVALAKKARRKAKNESKSNRAQGSGSVNYDSLSNSAKDSIRPKHRLKYSVAGENVDSIQWLRDQIKEKDSKIEDIRSRQENRGAAAVFVEFKTIADAQRAAQQVPSTAILALSPRYHGVTPNEVIWQNLPLSPERRVSQESTAAAIVFFTIVFWSIPSGFVGLISNISYLAENIEWLSWLNNLPDSVIGLLSGLVPPLLTSLLSKYVPKIFRAIFKSFGAATTSSNELRVQKWFYIFQVTQVFLVTAVFSSAATVFSQLLEKARDPATIPELLATQLPKSSNYYLTYFIIQGTTTAADNLLNYSDLLQYLVFGWLFDKTPRQKYSRYTSMKGIQWGKVFPKFANFAIIAIAYSCIAPMVTGFATIGLVLYYFSYRYNLLFVIEPKVDTGGRAYTLALQHLLTGVYIAELALIGIFGLNSATGPLIITAVLFLVTALYSALVDRYLLPLEKYLPTEIVEQVGAEESTPLLSSAEEGRADQPSSHIQRIGQQTRMPPKVVDPVARFFEPHVFASHQAMTTWLREDDDFQTVEDDAPEYQEEELKTAYLSPALKSSTPLIWLPKDDIGTSKNEIRENEEAGLKASDQGAWIDDKGEVRWSEKDFEEVPIWKAGIAY